MTILSRDPMQCEGCQFNCKTIQDLEDIEKIWNNEEKKYWWYITKNMKKVVCMGELQRIHTEICTGTKLIKI